MSVITEQHRNNSFSTTVEIIMNIKKKSIVGIFVFFSIFCIIEVSPQVIDGVKVSQVFIMMIILWS
jgi:hypothetical protein